MNTKICYKSIKIDVDSNNLIIAVDKKAIPKNLSCAFLILKNKINIINSDANLKKTDDKKIKSDIYPIYLKINSVLYPVLTNAGNHLMSDQICTRTRYNLVYGNNKPHFLLTNCCNIKATNFVADEVR